MVMRVFLVIAVLWISGVAFAWDTPLPDRYEVVMAPEGFAPTAHPAEGETGVRVACRAIPKERGKWVLPYALWELSNGEIHYPSVPAGYSEDSRVFATADDLLFLIESREDPFGQPQSIRHEFKQETYLLEVQDKDRHRGLATQASRYGPFIGHVYNPSTSQSIHPAIWSDRGELVRITDPRYHVFSILAASSTYAMGTLYRIEDWEEGRESSWHFVWSKDDGITVLPRKLEEGGTLVAVDVDAQGRVLMDSRVRRVVNEQLVSIHQPYIWTQADGLEPIPFPEGWSAKPLWLNARGHVLLDVYNPDTMPPLDRKKLQSHRLAVAALAGGEPIFLPKTLDEAFTERATGFSLDGAISIKGGPIQWIGKDRDYASYDAVTGAVLVPVYGKQRAK